MYYLILIVYCAYMLSLILFFSRVCVFLIAFFFFNLSLCVKSCWLSPSFPSPFISFMLVSSLPVVLLCLAFLPLVFFFPRVLSYFLFCCFGLVWFCLCFGFSSINNFCILPSSVKAFLCISFLLLLIVSFRFSYPFCFLFFLFIRFFLFVLIGSVPCRAFSSPPSAFWWSITTRSTRQKRSIGALSLPLWRTAALSKSNFISRRLPQNGKAIESAILYWDEQRESDRDGVGGGDRDTEKETDGEKNSRAKGKERERKEEKLRDASAFNRLLFQVQLFCFKWFSLFFASASNF